MTPDDTDILAPMPWKLYINDTFDHSSGVDKTGTDTGLGFYYLWFYSLLESITDWNSYDGKELTKVPGRGFNRFTLALEHPGGAQNIEVRVDPHLEMLFTIRGLFFTDYDGYGLDTLRQDVLKLLAGRHARSYYRGREDAFYESLADWMRAGKTSLSSLAEWLAAQ